MTTILNNDLQFSRISLEDRQAFLREPDKILFDAGTEFYKWTSYPLVGRDGRITPWWSFVITKRLPSGFVADGFRESQVYARRLGVSHRAYQQVRQAVSENFNNAMRNLLVVRLKTKVYGLAGPTSGQREFKDPALDNVLLIGGGGQAYLPGLTLARHIHQIPAVRLGVFA